MKRNNNCIVLTCTGVGIIFKIHFIGQGRVDAILLSNDGKYIFIDSGFRSNGLKCIKYMRRMGVSKLQYYISTHAHKNHCGGASPIISQFNPCEVIIPHDRVREKIIEYASGSEKAKVKLVKYRIITPASEPIQWGDLTIRCIGPIKIKKCQSWSIAENLNSLILRIDRQDRRMVLLTGDTSDSILEAIAKSTPGALQAEVLKNPHHEGAHSISVLNKIAPKIVVFCSSRLASKAYRAKIRSIGAEYYTACGKWNGNIILEDTGIGWAINEA